MMFVSLWVVKWKNSDMRYLGEVLEYGVVQGLNDVCYCYCYCYLLLIAGFSHCPCRCLFALIFILHSFYFSGVTF